MGAKALEPAKPGNPVADAMEAADASAVSDRSARAFRLYAENLGQDLKAIAACARDDLGVSAPAGPGGLRNPPDRGRAGRSRFRSRRHRLRWGTRAEIIPGTDHMFALPNPMFKGAVMDFLTGWN